jgi:hypothetical protein
LERGKIMSAFHKALDWNPGKNSRHRHWGAHIAMGAMAAAPFATFLISPDSPWSTVGVGTAAVVNMTGIVLYLGHADGPLCETCFSSLPANAPELASTKKRPYLKSYHFINDSKKRLVVMAVSLLIAIYAKGIFLDPGGLAHLVASLLVAALICAPLMVRKTHDLYMPWCPWCRRDDGDENNHVGDPDPSEKLPA